MEGRRLILIYIIIILLSSIVTCIGLILLMLSFPQHTNGSGSNGGVMMLIKWIDSSKRRAEYATNWVFQHVALITHSISQGCYELLQIWCDVWLYWSYVSLLRKANVLHH
jgi:hypothetical protein